MTSEKEAGSSGSVFHERTPPVEVQFCGVSMTKAAADVERTATVIRVVRRRMAAV